MSNVIFDNEVKQAVIDMPGAMLAAKRVQMNYSLEYVADKLHLRIRTIELLENDDYLNMPEPVFIKGYLRAYAKFLGLSPEPLIKAFDNSYNYEKKSGKALWQSKRESNKAEYVIKWLTITFAVVVVVAVGIWWHGNKEAEHMFSSNYQKVKKQPTNLSENEIRLTDLSKMRSLLSSNNQELAAEQESD